MRVLIWGIDEGTGHAREKKRARMRPVCLVWGFSPHRPHPSLSPPSLPLPKNPPLRYKKLSQFGSRIPVTRRLFARPSTAFPNPNGPDPTATPWTSSTFRWSLVSSFPHDTLHGTYRLVDAVTISHSVSGCSLLVSRRLWVSWYWCVYHCSP
jgi:hypothetical protein